MQITSDSGSNSDGIRHQSSLAARVEAAYARCMLLIVGTVRLPPGKLSDARPVMRRMVEGSREEAGCLEYSYAEDIFDAGLIHVKEMWSDQAALDRHFASDHIETWRAAWPSLGIHDRDLRVYDVGDPRQT